ncbi:Acetylspermidine deacetylase [Minicystis rosea]|nr:Acetylspermidine deacetylase [Minicystis rosea]
MVSPTMPDPRNSSLYLAFDPLFFEHRSRGYHPERPERLEAARRGLARCESAGAQVVALAPRDATDAEILAAHDAAYLAELKKLEGHYASLDADTYLAPASLAAARRAAGGAIALAEALVAAGEGDPKQGVALLRPPGHHATRHQGMGFCLLNNVALAAYAALARGLSRVAIVDWDVHHGNGTQDIFWTDDRVLFVSLHESPLYPGTGAAREIGEGRGRGYTLNIPLPASSNDAVYRLAFDEIVLPALHRYAPELVLVSAGFDGHARDPLASMLLTDVGYGWMARALRDVADATAGGRIGLVLEGGYDLPAIEASMAAAIQGALGSPAPAPSSEVGPRHAEAVEQIREAVEAAGPVQVTEATSPVR